MVYQADPLACTINEMRLDAIARTAVAAAIGGLVMVTIVADRMIPPAYKIADQYATLAAILIVATVLTTMVDSRSASSPNVWRCWRIAWSAADRLTTDD